MGRGNTGAIVALVFFFLTSVGTGFLVYTQYNRVELMPEAGGEEGLREQYRKVVEQRKALEETLVTKKAELQKVRAELGLQQDRKRAAEGHLQNGSLVALSADRDRKVSEGWQKVTASENPLTTAQSKSALEDCESHKGAAVSRNDQRIRVVNETIKENKEAIEKTNQEIRTESERMESDHAKLRNVLSELRRKVEELVTREPPPGLPPVGKVVTSDPEHDLAVINLGTRHGVKAGMRFQVAQVNAGGSRVSKGFVEVKKAHPEGSTCLILVREVRLSRCPICKYVAQEPHERYCPRCTRRDTTQGAQRLTDIPKVEVRGKILTNPIVKGDLVFNPLFSPEARRRYAITGKPLIPRHSEFSLEAVKRVVEFHGNQVQEKLNARTDVLIALQGGDGVKRARELGIPIIYGWQLFKYLDR
jgi:hypothetical protein